MSKEQYPKDSANNFPDMMREIGRSFLGKSENVYRIWRVRTLVLAVEGVSILAIGSQIHNDNVTLVGIIAGGVGLAAYRGIKKNELRELRRNKRN